MSVMTDWIRHYCRSRPHTATARNTGLPTSHRILAPVSRQRMVGWLLHGTCFMRGRNGAARDLAHTSSAVSSPLLSQVWEGEGRDCARSDPDVGGRQGADSAVAKGIAAMGRRGVGYWGTKHGAQKEKDR